MPPSAPPRPSSPRAKARWTACLLVALLALGAGEWLARHNAELARQEAGDHQLQIARQLADRLSRDMADRMQDVQRLAELDVLHPVTDMAAARTALEGLQSSLDSFAWIGVTDPEGTVVAATGDILLGQSIASRPVFENGIRGLWTGDVHEIALRPEDPAIRCVDVAAPIRGPEGNAIGVIALHLDWHWAERLRERVLDPGGAPPSLQLQIVSARGDVLLPADKSRPQATLTASRIAALDGNWGLALWTDGNEALTSVSESRPAGAFRGLGWHVVARDVPAAALTSVQAARPPAYGWTLGAGALAALTICWLIGLVMTTAEPAAPLSRPQPLAPVAGTVRPHRRSDVPSPPAVVARRTATAKDRDDHHPKGVDPDHLDPLTGLWNRGYLPDVTESLRASMAEGTTEICVLSVDLDGFQQVNERYGHAAGDDVLAQVARRLRHAARAGDPVFRLGGDEFLILMTCPLGEAAALARSVAGRVLAELHRPLSYRTLSNVRISATIGGAMWPTADGQSLMDAIGHADEALHAAKLGGRGTFRLYAGLPASHGTDLPPHMQA